MRKIVYLLSFVFTITSCSTKVSKQESVPDNRKWSQKMADNVMEGSPELTKYVYNIKEANHWQYDIAFLGQAIARLESIDKKYADYHRQFIDNFIDSTGTIATYELDSYNIDNINAGKGIFEIYKQTNDKRYDVAIQTLMQQIEKHPKTREGGLWHKNIYPSQMWLDGIYMGSPFIAQYAKEYNQPQWFDFVALQITLIYSKTKDPKTGLCFHAWDESKKMPWSNPETGLSSHFWGRSMGWYIMAIVDVLDFMPAEHPKRQELITILNAISKAILDVQDPESKMWYQVMDQGKREGNYLEMSSTSMFIYAFAKGANKGYLPKSYFQVANEAFDSMIKNNVVVSADGKITITSICAAAGLGGNPYRDGTFEYYINERKQDNDCKGVAPFILAAIELDR